MELMREILEELKTPEAIVMFSMVILFPVVMSPLLIKLWKGPDSDTFDN